MEDEIMSEVTEHTPESVQSQIKRTRHKAEIPLYIISIILGSIALVAMYAAIFGEYGIVDKIKEGLTLADITEANPEFGSILFGFIAAFALLGGFGFFCYLVIMQLYIYYQQYSDEMCYSIRVTEENFPEIYAKAQEFSQLLGWKKAPEIYIQQMDGSINAMASWVPGKKYVHLNAEVVDIQYLEHKDFDTLCFVMAHEFGHLYLHHVQIYYNFWSSLAVTIPVAGKYFLAPLLSRAREYSADRVAQALTGECGTETMMFLTAGRHLYKYANAEDYMAWVNKDKNFIEKFARFVRNMLSSHPVTPFRTKAILDPTQKSGRLL